MTIATASQCWCPSAADWPQTGTRQQAEGCENCRTKSMLDREMANSAYNAVEGTGFQ